MASAPEPLNDRVRVLIADDEHLFVEMVEAILSADPRFQVVARAFNGQDAVDYALAYDPDVILMDISMPVMDGIEAIERIRKKLPHACALVVTGANTASEIDRARKAGAAGYLTKDRIATELLPAIHDLAAR